MGLAAAIERGDTTARMAHYIFLLDSTSRAASIHLLLHMGGFYITVGREKAEGSWPWQGIIPIGRLLAHPLVSSSIVFAFFLHTRIFYRRRRCCISGSLCSFDHKKQHWKRQIVLAKFICLGSGVAMSR